MGLRGSLFGIMAMMTKATMDISMHAGSIVQQGMQNIKNKWELKKLYETVLSSNMQNRNVFIMPKIDKSQLYLNVATQEPDVYECAYNGNNAAYDFIYGVTPQAEAMIVSGGDSTSRCKALEPFVRKSLEESKAVVALHAGTDDLETYISKLSPNVESVSKNNYYYDVFKGMTAEDISVLLSDLYKYTHQDVNKPEILYLLRAITEVLINKSSSFTVSDIANFKLNNFKDELDELKKNNYINLSEYKEIEQYYLSGLSEVLSVETFLNELNRQFTMVFGQCTGNKDSNIKKVLNQKGIITFNVGKIENDMVVSLIVSHLKILKMQNKDFNIVIEGIELPEHEGIKNLFKICSYAVSHTDFIASLYSSNKNGEHLFAEVMGNVGVTVLLQHSSGVSCEKWSAYMGKYKKLNINYSAAQQSTGAFGQSLTSGISVEEREEPRIRSETINHIRLPTACIYRADRILIANL